MVIVFRFIPPPVAIHSGDAGVVSTTADYQQFTQCILNKGELNGVRLLGAKTVDLMTCNHLPSALPLIAFEGSEPLLGVGIGLGFSLILDTAQSAVMGPVVDHGWGGYAETLFSFDPKEDMIAILITHYLPSQTYPIRKEFRTAVSQV